MKNFISIPKPCNENWDAMTPKEQGRHCSKCKIVVKDFSSMSNEEILQYLKLNTGHVCGRVREEQLSQTPTLSRKLKRFLYAFTLCFLPFLTLTSILMTNSQTVYAQASPGGIDGKILDSKGNPVPFARVGAFQGGVLKGQGKTNFKGNFKIKPLNSGTYTLKVSSVGLKKVEITRITVRSGRSTTQNVKMTGKSRRLTGGIRLGVFRNRIINPENPGGQEISGDELRNMLGR